MKGEAKRLKKEVDALVQDIHPDQIYDIYLKKSYESKKRLWLDDDLDGFNKSEAELVEFMKNLLPSQRKNVLIAELESYNNIAYDLRCRIRSKTMHFITIIIAHHHLFEMILDDLDTYERTRDKYWYESAKDLLKELNKAFKNRHWNDEAIQRFETYISHHQKQQDLTDDEKEHLELLSLFTRNYRVIQGKRLK